MSMISKALAAGLCPGYGKLMKKMLLLSQRNCFQNNIRKKIISG
ncbi:hypothetical protein [Enterocloster clostridioformis]|nr:hypothetical protein [Enterocloster clostridioformis]